MRAQLPCSMWDLSSPTRNRTYVPCIGKWILNYWIVSKVSTQLLAWYFLIEVCVKNALHTTLKGNSFKEVIAGLQPQK